LTSIFQFASASEREAGVLITEGSIVAVLYFGGGPVAIVDSHQYDGYGALVCTAASSTKLVHWYKKSFQKLQPPPHGKSVHINLARIQFSTYLAPRLQVQL